VETAVSLPVEFQRAHSGPGAKILLIEDSGQHRLDAELAVITLRWSNWVGSSRHRLALRRRTSVGASTDQNRSVFSLWSRDFRPTDPGKLPPLQAGRTAHEEFVPPPATPPAPPRSKSPKKKA